MLCIICEAVIIGRCGSAVVRGLGSAQAQQLGNRPGPGELNFTDCLTLSADGGSKETATTHHNGFALVTSPSFSQTLRHAVDEHPAPTVGTTKYLKCHSITIKVSGDKCTSSVSWMLINQINKSTEKTVQHFSDLYNNGLK